MAVRLAASLVASVSLKVRVLLVVAVDLVGKATAVRLTVTSATQALVLVAALPRHITATTSPSAAVTKVADLTVVAAVPVATPLRPLIPVARPKAIALRLSTAVPRLVALIQTTSPKAQVRLALP